MKVRLKHAASILGIFCLLFLQSCQRRQDIEVIKANYSSFRDALLKHDNITATKFVSFDYLTLYSPEKIPKSFSYLLETNMQLNASCWIKFDDKTKSKAWLFPQAPPTVGYQFVKETNGWKITLNVFPIVD
jgi:hypothetical protein